MDRFLTYTPLKRIFVRFESVGPKFKEIVFRSLQIVSKCEYFFFISYHLRQIRMQKLCSQNIRSSTTDSLFSTQVNAFFRRLYLSYRTLHLLCIVRSQ